MGLNVGNDPFTAARRNLSADEAREASKTKRDWVVRLRRDIPGRFPRCFGVILPLPSPSEPSVWFRGIEHPKYSEGRLRPNGISPSAVGTKIERALV